MSINYQKRMSVLRRVEALPEVARQLRNLWTDTTLAFDKTPEWADRVRGKLDGIRILLDEVEEIAKDDLWSNATRLEVSEKGE